MLFVGVLVGVWRCHSCGGSGGGGGGGGGVGYPLGNNGLKLPANALYQRYILKARRSTGTLRGKDHISGPFDGKDRFFVWSQKEPLSVFYHPRILFLLQFK